MHIFGSHYSVHHKRPTGELRHLAEVSGHAVLRASSDAGTQARLQGHHERGFQGGNMAQAMGWSGGCQHAAPSLKKTGEMH